MIKKCAVCNKEFEAIRPTKNTCSDVCRQKYHRKSSTVTKIVPIVTDTVTKTPTVTSIVTDRKVEKELKFTNETREERLKKYHELYPKSSFVPNWIASGYNSREEAIQKAMELVRGKCTLGI